MCVDMFSVCRALGKEPAYPRSLQKHSGYTLEQLQPAAHALAALQAKAPNSSLPAVFKKYSQHKFHEVITASLIAGHGVKCSVQLLAPDVMRVSANPTECRSDLDLTLPGNHIPGLAMNSSGGLVH